MQKFETKEILLSSRLTKKDLLEIEMNDFVVGFQLGQIKLDDLLDNDAMCSLPLEKSINTEVGLLTWTLNAGWILVPEKDGQLQWLQFETLADFLTRHGKYLFYKYKLDWSTEGARIRMFREYVDELQQSLSCLNELMDNENKYDMDLLIGLIKEYRTSETVTLNDIRAEIVKEIELTKSFILNLTGRKLLCV